MSSSGSWQEPWWLGHDADPVAEVDDAVSSWAIARMYVSKVSLQGIRSFRKLSLDLVPRSETKRPTARLHTLLIGENGTGKTTLLRAIAVGLADRSDASGLLSEPTGQFVAEGKKMASITIGVVPRWRSRTPRDA